MTETGVTPAAGLSERLLEALHERRRLGERLVPLHELAAGARPASLRKAVAAEPFASAALLLPLTKALTLAALAAEREAVPWDDRLLLALLEAKTTAKKPYARVADLAAALPADHREAFAAAVGQRLADAALPAAVAVRDDDGEPRLCLEANRPALDRLGERVLTGLARRRGAGDYPATLCEIVRAELPGTLPEQVEALVKDKRFKAKLAWAVPGRLDAPLALAGDEEALAASGRLVEFAVGLLSTADQPLHPLKKVAGALAKPLRPVFEQAIGRRIADGSLPPGVAHHAVGGKPHLRLTRHPLPPPPEEALAGRLLAALRAARDAGRYPALFDSLLIEVGRPPPKLVKAALALPAFANHGLIALVGRPDSLVVLLGDGDRLAADGRLLSGVLRSRLDADNEAVAVAELGKKEPSALRGAFAAAIARHIESGTLPAGVGCLRIKKKPYLYLRPDAPPRPEVPPPADFAHRFDEAFARLDRERGSANLVSLVRLRQELSAGRDEFDAQLQQLRRAGRYTLSGAEGRHGVSDEERAAAIGEHGSLLLYVSRREE